MNRLLFVLTTTGQDRPVITLSAPSFSASFMELELFASHKREPKPNNPSPVALAGEIVLKINSKCAESKHNESRRKNAKRKTSPPVRVRNFHPFWVYFWKLRLHPKDFGMGEESVESGMATADRTEQNRTDQHPVGHNFNQLSDFNHIKSMPGEEQGTLQYMTQINQAR